MVNFIGEYTSKIDDKGRIVFPAPFKGAMGEGADLTFIVKKDIFADCLEMYTLAEWNRRSEETRSRLNFFNPKHAAFWREYTHDCVKVTPDAKLGRITISKKLLDAIGVTKEVVFSGSDFKIDIWAKEKFEQNRLSNEEFLSIAESLPQPR